MRPVAPYVNHTAVRLTHQARSYNPVSGVRGYLRMVHGMMRNHA